MNTDGMTPLSYAARLVGYISDPSTVYAYTKAEFGRAPSIERIRNLREAKLKKPVRLEGMVLRNDRFRPALKCGHPETDDNFEIDINGIDRCKTCADAARAKREAERIERERLAEQAKEERLAEQARLKAMAERLRREQAEAVRAVEEAIRKLDECAEAARAKVVTETFSQVAEAFGISPADIRSRDKRSKVYCDARCALTLIFRARGHSYPVIGRWLDRDHTSVLYLYQTAEARIKRNPLIGQVVKVLP